MQEQEIIVYVIENNQPFKNWTGIWRFFKVIDDVGGFYVENNDGDLINVNKDNVFEVDTNMPIDEYIEYINNKNTLLRFGLSSDESDIFQSLLKKMTIPEDCLNAFYNELDEAIPFEGGMCFNEALVGLLYH